MISWIKRDSTEGRRHFYGVLLTVVCRKLANEKAKMFFYRENTECFKNTECWDSVCYQNLKYKYSFLDIVIEID